MYHIVEQSEGRGDNKKAVLIKVVTRGVTTENGKVSGMFPLKSAKGNPLPCLKVVLEDPAQSDHHFEVRWSNYHEQVSDSPGKFRLVRIDHHNPDILYQTENGRKVLDPIYRSPLVDYIEMAKRYGTEATWSDDKKPKFLGWVWGQKQVFLDAPIDMAETELLDMAEHILTERFGDELANAVLTLFVEHPLFHKFYESSFAG